MSPTVKKPCAGRYLFILGIMLALTGGPTCALAQSQPATATAPEETPAAPNPPATGSPTSVDDFFPAAQKAGMSIEEQIAMLEQVVSKLSQIVNAQSATDAQILNLKQFEEKLAILKARLLIPRINALRAEAEKAIAEGQFDDAEVKLHTALNWQRQINRSKAPAGIKDVSNERGLVMLLQQTDAQPAIQAVAKDLELARQAVKDSRLTEAQAAYARARESQLDINKRFVGTVYASQSVIAQIDAELATAQSTSLSRDIQLLNDQADSAAKNGKPGEAARLLQDAMLKQHTFETLYPNATPPVSLDDLDRKYQTLLSLSSMEAIAGLDRQCAELLRAGSIQQAITVARQAHDALEKVWQEFPKSDRLDRLLMRKFIFIGLRADELPAIQEQINRMLLPVPAHPGLLMQKIEVTQELYVRIANINPSRNHGANLPVDSLNWSEADNFCLRLSWLMGVTVRLPTLDEWRAATGSIFSPGWTAENSENHSQETGRSPANAAGFYDLTGNLAEWLQPTTPLSSEAPIAGGSFMDTAADIQKTSVKSLDRTTRNRYVGFRIVVDKN
ncbi:MAG TPA: SUMF1/EgtB/PvdO family nonheme iron enzyme [Rariglobus sp.]|nr:SUMF1/EgtB/PvdO family nonheme iron enzyme [Rariglobus sp.]